MSRNAPIRADALNQSAEAWLRLGLSHLEDPAVKARLGAEKAARLHKIARRAGRILVTENAATIARTRHGLYLVPTPKDMPDDYGLKLRKGKQQIWFPLSRYTHEDSIQHIATPDLADEDFIVVPEESKLSGPERAAKFIHHLVHADQLRRGVKGRLPGESFDQMHARLEAEGYQGQFAVLDAAWDGALSRVVAANATAPDALELEFPRDMPEEVMERIEESTAALLALGVMVRCQAHGYTPDGATAPDPQLTSELAQFQIFEPDPSYNIAY